VQSSTPVIGLQTQPGGCGGKQRVEQTAAAPAAGGQVQAPFTHVGSGPVSLPHTQPMIPPSRWRDGQLLAASLP
jgi:hypothetical protein